MKPNDPIPKAKLCVSILFLAAWAATIAQLFFLMHRQDLLERQVADSFSAYIDVLQVLHSRQTATENVLKAQYDMDKYAKEAVAYNKTKPKRGPSGFVGIGGFPDYAVNATEASLLAPPPTKP